MVFNTIFVLLEQAAQVRCFGNVAKRLKSDGAFVIEAFVPDPARFHQKVSAAEVGLDRVRLDASHHDPVAQRITSQTIFLSDGSIDMRPIKIRYAWPSELDLMAQLAGLRLQDALVRIGTSRRSTRRAPITFRSMSMTTRAKGPTPRRRLFLADGEGEELGVPRIELEANGLALQLIQRAPVVPRHPVAAVESPSNRAHSCSE